MKIFLAYAGEQEQRVERIAFALRNEGHTVFFDEHNLQPGGNYNRPIRDAINASDIFVYCISPESVAGDHYALTELEFARKHFKKAVNHVLPVMLEPIPLDAVPPWASSVTVVTPVGDEVAYIVDAVAGIVAALEDERQAKKPSARQRAHLLLVIVTAGLLLNTLYWWILPRLKTMWLGALVSLTGLVLLVLIYRYRSRLMTVASPRSFGALVTMCLVLVVAGWLGLHYQPVVVQLLPGATLMGRIPLEPRNSPFGIDLHIGDSEMTLPHFGKSGIALGADPSVVHLALTRSVAQQEEALRQYLVERQVPERHHAAFLEWWRKPGAKEVGLPLYSGTDIGITLLESGVPVSSPPKITWLEASTRRIAVVELH